MNNNLDALLRRASKIAEHQFKKYGVIDAFWIVEKADGKQSIVVAPVMQESDSKRNEMLAGLSKAFRDLGVWRYACALESWVSSDTSCRPAQAPDRREVVVLIAEDGGATRGGMREIIRSSAPPRLGRLVMSEAMGGRFTGLLNAARSGATVQ